MASFRVGLEWPVTVISGFVLIYLLTENNAAKRRAGERSAYSVFNPNCERIDGTIDVAQFEQEIRFVVYSSPSSSSPSSSSSSSTD